MKTNIYVLVFGIVAALIIIAAISTLFFNQKSGGLVLQNLGKAPSIQGITYWINSQPLNITQLRGKVVLVDFWTYSCVNCIRTIPFLNDLQSMYGNNGLVIIGVHTPEFQFEKNYTNVLNAVQKFGIKYPVALDSNYGTWNSYNNRYWPADYLIDANGTIRYESFGEGDFNNTAAAIRELLLSAGYNLGSGAINYTDPANFSLIGSPELYLGYTEARQSLGNSQGFTPNTTVNYTIRNITQPNAVYLLGQWYNAPQSMIAMSNSSKIFLVYDAKYANIVAGGNSSISIKLDTKNINQTYFGSDVHLRNGIPSVVVNSSRLYNIVAAPSYGEHILEIDAKPGFKIYTFTFG